MIHNTRAQRWLGLGLLLLGGSLVLNTVLGPLVLDLIDYPFTETVRNEALGLEAVSLLLVAPLSIAAGLLALRGHRAAAVLALGPTGYATYMLVQYVVGPQYPTYQPAVAFHVALLALSGVLFVAAWSAIDPDALPMRSRRSQRRWAIVVLLTAAFVVSRWASVFTGIASGGAVPAAQADLTMYWSIFMLDLGFVAPAALATAAGLAVGVRWAGTALYGVIGWFALVPPSVAAMALVKVLRDDPNAVARDLAVLAVVAIVLFAVAGILFRRLFGTPASVDASPAGRARVAAVSH